MIADLSLLTPGVSLLRVAAPGGVVTASFMGITRMVDAAGAMQSYACVSVGPETWLVDLSQVSTNLTPVVTKAMEIAQNEAPPHEVSIATGDAGAAVTEHP